MRRLVAVLALALVVAASCGDDSSQSSPAPEPGSDDSAAAPSVEDDPGDDDGPIETPGGGELDEGGGRADDDLSDELELGGCPVGAHLDGGGPVEIELWHPYTALTEEAIDDVADAFNASQDTVVVTVEAQGDYGELLAKYREGINFGTLPDVAIFDSQTFRDIVDSATTVPAQSCVEADGVGLDAIDESVRAFFSLDGALFPASMNVSTPVLYYNREHFTAAGLDPDTPPTTLAELHEAARAISEAGVAETPLSLLMHGWFVDTWLTGARVPLVDADNGRAGDATRATFNTPEALEVFELLDTMNDEGLVLPTSNTPGQIGHFLAMASAQASMLLETSTAATSVAGVLGGTADLSELVEAGAGTGVTDLSIDLDVAPFPGLREPGRVFISGGTWYIMNTGSEAEQAGAWEFLKFVNQIESQKTIHLKGSYLPINPAVLDDPDVQAVWADDAAGQWLSTAYGQLATIDPDFSGPVIGPFTEYRESIQDALESVLLTGTEPAEALAEAQVEVDEALARYADQNF